ncbi:MAG: RNA 2',3'-cyclic phosphodiesterase [Pirellulaceae bacterium]|nr:RNA 2',3'-cyclic phosphodiesterase [Pirellulaceae bacterium]
MNKIRTFVAVEISEAVRRRAARLIDLLRSGGGDVKWVEPENMHLTLQFLGDVEQADVPAVCQAVERAAAGFPPFEISLLGAGAFPHLGRPSTIWIGVVDAVKESAQTPVAPRGHGDGAKDLVALQRAVQRALKPLGFPPERRAFHPHLTIGRIRRGGAAPPSLVHCLREQQAFDAGSTTIDQVVVFASYLERSGPTYQAMSRIVLAGSEAAR